MKIRSREINIISMSALDMFCAALGAFMFLALLSIPFAPNLGPEAKEVEQLRKDNQSLREQLKRTTAERDAAQQELKKAIEQRATDIALVIDTTGSMSAPIDSLKEEIGNLAQILGRLTDRARIAIVAYKDSVGACAGTQSIQVQPLTLVDDAGITSLQTFARSLTAEAPCNNTPDEDVYLAMRTAAGLQWSAEPRNRYIVVIGDNPAHPDEIDASQQLARQWGGGGAHLSTLRIESPNTAILPGSAAFYDSLARNGNGSALLPGSSFALSILLGMTQK